MEEKVYILFHEYEFGKEGDVRDFRTTIIL